MDSVTNSLKSLTVKDNDIRSKISIYSNQLNTMCQVLKLPRPVRFELNCGAQLLPVIMIGQKQYIAKNWLISRDQKIVKLLQYIIDRLNDNKYVALNKQELYADSIETENVFCDEDQEPIEMSFKISF